MSEKTKKNALKKLDKFNVKIGYPDKWKNYSDLKISDESLINNLLNSYRFKWKNLLKKINKKKDKDEWEMLPHQVNAYFHPEMNEIVFPAAILQNPFFDINSDDATNYGGIGTVIGHEITHGFDDQGRKYDHNGNLNNWWTDEDLVKFTKLAKQVEKQFSEKKILNILVNGKLTLGENIADLGGLTIAYHALQNKLNLKKKTNELDLKEENINFFKSWANIWKSLITDEEQKNRLMTDPHAPNSLRINEPLKNMSEFCDLFNVNEGDGMFRKNKIKIW